MCNIRLKAEARKPSLGSGFMTSLKLVHQGGLQTFGEKGFLDSQLLQDVPNKGKKKSEQAGGNTVLIALFSIFSDWKNFPFKNTGFFNPLNREIF